MGEDALDGDANLAGVVEAAFCEGWGGEVEVGRFVDNNRGGAAVFEGAAGAGGELGAEHPADVSAADEGEEGDAWVAYGGGGEIAVFEDEGLAPLGRETGFVEELDEAEAGEGGV